MIPYEPDLIFRLAFYPVTELFEVVLFVDPSCLVHAEPSDP